MSPEKYLLGNTARLETAKPEWDEVCECRTRKGAELRRMAETEADLR
jgi:hypothetical protein